MNATPILFTVLQTGAGANGGVASISNVMGALDGYRPVVLTNRESERTGQWRDAGHEVHVVPERVTGGVRRDPLGYARTYFDYHRAVGRILSASGARVVHANDPAAFQLSLTAARRAGARIALNLRDTLDPGRKAPRFKYERMFRAADETLYLSQDMADRWAEVAPGARRSFAVTYSIVDLERFAPAPEPTGQKVILLSGMVCPKKNQLDFLLNVAPHLVEAGARIRIAGDFDPEASGYAAACRDAADRLGPSVEMLGYRTDLPDLIRSSHLVAVASKHEGLVRSMIEAMAGGRPVVSTPVCSAREMLEEQGERAGAVVPFDEPRRMADAILRLAGSADGIEAGRAGRKIAERLFRRDRVAARYADCYRRLAGRD